MSNTKNDHLVSVSNELIRAVHLLNLNEKRLLMLAITKLDSSSSDNKMINITIDEFVAQYKLKKHTTYQRLKESAKTLQGKTVSFKLDEKTTRSVVWVQTCDYVTDEAWIRVRFSDDLAKTHLLNLREKFTTYILNRIGESKSLYTWRLFELIMQFKNTGLLKISVSEFLDIMEAKKVYRDDFGRVRQKIINPAVNEIKKIDGLHINWETIKAGRKVTCLKFTFPIEQQTTLPLKKAPTETKSKTQQVKEEKYLEILSTIAGANNLANLTGKSIENYLSPEALTFFKQQNNKTLNH